MAYLCNTESEENLEVAALESTIYDQFLLEYLDNWCQQ